MVCGPPGQGNPSLLTAVATGPGATPSGGLRGAEVRAVAGLPGITGCTVRTGAAPEEE
jgi:hypothetical protein